MIRSLPHVEFSAPLWLEKDSHETSHWKLEHPFNGLVSNSSRSISPFFGVFIFPSRSRWTSGTFHNRLCWSTMKGGTWVSLLHCCKLQWAQYDVAVRCLQQMISLIATSTWQKTSRGTTGDRRLQTRFYWIACWKLLVIVLWPNNSLKMGVLLMHKGQDAGCSWWWRNSRNPKPQPRQQKLKAY